MTSEGIRPPANDFVVAADSARAAPDACEELFSGVLCAGSVTLGVAEIDDFIRVGEVRREKPDFGSLVGNAKTELTICIVPETPQVTVAENHARVCLRLRTLRHGQRRYVVHVVAKVHFPQRRGDPVLSRNASLPLVHRPLRSVRGAVLPKRVVLGPVDEF